MAKVLDSFINVLKGFGGNKDVIMQRRYAIDRIKSFNIDELRSMYATNWLAGKVVDIPVGDAMRAGRAIQGTDADTIYKEYDRLKIDTKVADALKWGRAYGGSIIVIVSNDNDMEQPLSMIGKGDLKNIAVFDRFEAIGIDINRDPLSSNYLEPTYYMIKGATQKIHYSRVIKIMGYTNSNYMKDTLQGFGLSIFEKMYHVIGDAQESNDHITNLLAQSNVDVYKMNGLNEAVSAGMDDVAISRVQVAQSMKSILNAIILDKDDDYSSIAKNFSTLPEIDNGKLAKVAGASDIPLTRLLGKSADGMNATGTGDLKNYYDMVSSYQMETMYDVYKRLDKVVCENIGLPQPEFMFNSLFQMSEAEKADIELKRAQTDAIHLTNAVITEADVMQRLAESDMYSSITQERVDEVLSLGSELDNTYLENENVDA